MTSLTDWLDAKEDDEPEAAPPKSDQPYLHGTGESVFDRFHDAIDWPEFMTQSVYDWEVAKPPDAETEHAFKRPGGTSPVSAKVPKAKPYVLVVHSTDAGLPAGGGKRLTKGRLYALKHYSGDLKAAAKALVDGTAVGLPAHVVDACRGAGGRGPFGDLKGLISDEEIAKLMNKSVEPPTRPADNAGTQANSQQLAGRIIAALKAQGRNVEPHPHEVGGFMSQCPNPSHQDHVELLIGLSADSGDVNLECQFSEGDPCDPTDILGWLSVSGDPVAPQDQQPAGDPATPGDTELDWEADFWSARPELTHAFDFALSRRVAPWALLGQTLANVVYHVPPWVKLPAIIGHPASLNLFACMVSRSGGGKNTTAGAARDAFELNTDHIYTVPVGSGEGLVKQYAHWSARDGGQVIDRNAVLFTCAEVDALGALKNRSGSTLLSQLREAYSGGALGFAYSDNQNRVRMAEHSYRLCFVVGVQPKRAEALLNDQEIAGGTPQRFTWFAASDARITAEDLPEPPVLVIQKTYGPWTPDISSRYMIQVCAEARQEILDNHVKSQRGESDAIDGHALLTREKVAAALAILNDRPGPLEINAEDWSLAGLVMRHSDSVRESVLAELKQQREKENDARAYQEGRREAIKSGVVEDNDIARAAHAIGLRLTPAWQTRNEIKDGLNKKNRSLFDDAWPRLIDAGYAEAEESEYKGRSVLKLRVKAS